jgi:phospho-N-acetylmuramoyl-pentapeptide-transferase
MESGGVGFLFALLVTPLWIRSLTRRSFGQQIHADLLSTHDHKAGTPTMGGVIIVVAGVAGYLMGHVGTSIVFTRSGILVISVIVASGFLGFLDDYLSIRNARNLGLNKRGKFAGQLVIAAIFAVLAIDWVHTSTNHLHAALDLGLVAVGLVGGCLGFLWWNAAPAKIIMGDTGALAIGSGLGALCLLMNLDLLLPIIGGLFVMETASVIVQVISFRLFGRRVFRITPIHHHFEFRGWPEFTIIVRFWILAGLLAMFGLGIFYGDFLKIAKVV